MLPQPSTAESYFRALFAAGGEAFIVADEHGQVIDCNDAALDLFACQRADLLGTTPLDWSPAVQPDGRRSDESAAEIFSRAAAGETVRFEWENRRLDGVPVFVGVTVRRAAIEGQACYLVISRDISGTRKLQAELVASEKRFRDLAENTSEWIWALDLNGRHTYSNRNVTDILGFRLEEFLACDPVALVHPDDLDLFAATFAAARDKRTGWKNIVIRWRHQDGSYRLLESSAAPILDAQGVLQGFHGVDRDITESRRAEEALRVSERRFSQLIQNSYDTIVILDADGIQRYVSPSAERVHGYAPAELVDLPVIERMVHPDDRDQVQAAFLEIIRTGSGGAQYRHRCKTGGWVHLEARGTNQLHNPDIRGVVVNVRDITLLNQAEVRYRTLFDEMLDGFAVHEIICDAVGKPVDYRFLSVNPAFERMTGLKAKDVTGRRVLELLPGTEAYWIDTYGRVALSGEPAHFENFSADLNKHFEVRAFRPAPGSFACLFQDITERKRAEEKINTLAFYDQLTGLPNRTLLADRLTQAMASAERNDMHGALLFIDLDNFKTLNDTRGHEAGDILLKQVAERLKSHIRGEDTAARQGGDEFVLLLSGLGSVEAEAAHTAEVIANKLLVELNRNYPIGGLTHYCTASIGVALFKGKSTSVEALMKQADLAMYRAKATGGRVVRFFDPAIEAAIKTRAELEADLRGAIAEKQLLLHYQPQMLGDGRVTGAEVLVRWRHPRRGIMSPADFIPLAEETDLILPLGRWVLETACDSIAAWAREPRLAGLSIAVNVSARQFRQPDFVEEVFSVIHDKGINPRRLKLELTETVMVQDIEEIIEKMRQLKGRGIGFSLDDFGTGYSSLSYLKRLPLDQLKIDQSFVRDVLSDPNDAAIAKTIVALGQSLGLAVIAEGVETCEQKDFLAGNGCHAYQGYYFSRPLALGDFEEFVRRID